MTKVERAEAVAKMLQMEEAVEEKRSMKLEALVAEEAAMEEETKEVPS